MQEYKLPISRKILLEISVVGIFIILISSLLKIYGQNYSTLLFGIALLSQCILWIIVVIDLMNNRIRNRILWLLGMLLLPPLAIILYLLNREKHLKLL